MTERLDKDDKKKLAELLDGLKCPKEFVCYTSGQRNLCRAKDIGLESFLVCLEKDQTDCTFSVVFGGMHFCQCPLRIYIARKLTG